MTISVFHYSQDSYAATIVTTAFIRSFTVTQVESNFYTDKNNLPAIAVLINPKDTERNFIRELAESGRKIIIFGRLEKLIAKDLGLEIKPLTTEAKEWGIVHLDLDQQYNTSSIAIHYNKEHFLGQSSVLNPRFLCRYDFTDEWNNLGYGRITTDENPWSLCNIVNPNTALPVAWLVKSGENMGAYATLTESDDSAILWYNRQVGPVDSLEWRVIEDFCSNYRCDSLVCLPHLCEIPYGFAGAVTMRLDCDQDVASARPLFELYANAKIPFSLAVVTGLPLNKQDIKLLEDVIASGGSVISHSQSHSPNWGGNYEAALNEAKAAKKWLEEYLKYSTVNYAVSPFHQNPVYAVQALAEAGYLGFVSGIIHNDPEYLFGRAGRAPFSDRTIISHSQQCMLHGDCYHRYGNSVEPYCQSFTNHLKSKSIFGYLDHPFSQTYQYGWLNELERIEAHKKLIEFIQSYQNVLFFSINECLNFLQYRDRINIFIDEKGKLTLNVNHSTDKIYSIQLNWCGNNFTI
jgi:hypothetical protein